MGSALMLPTSRVKKVAPRRDALRVLGVACLSGLNTLAGAREQRCARIEASERVQASHRTGHVRG